MKKLLPIVTIGSTLILIFGGFFFSSCKKVSFQGVKGWVEFQDGDYWSFNPYDIKTYSVKRTIYFFEKTHINDVEPKGYSDFYSSIDSTFIATTISDDNGEFEILLDPGEYSVFVWEDGAYYAKESGGNGYLCPIVVKEGEITTIRIVIDYNLFW